MLSWLVFAAALTSYMWLALCVAAPFIIGYLLYKNHKAKKEKSETINQIHMDLDEIEADLDEHLAVDNSGGKVVRFETLKK